MRLALKFTAALVSGIVLVLALYDWYAVEDHRRDLEGRITDDLALVARGLAVAVPDLAQGAGEGAAERLIDERNREGNARVRWVRLDAPAGDARAVTLAGTERAALARDGALVVQRDDRLFVYRRLGGLSPVDAVEVSESLAPVRAKERRERLLIIARSIAILLVSGVYALVLGVRLVGRPVEGLVAAARRIGGGDLETRIAVDGTDEIALLGDEMDLMRARLADTRARLADESKARLAALEQLRHADRLKTVGQLASGVAHELGTPLNVVAAHAKIIAAGDGSPDELQGGARVIVEQVGRITGIIRQLLDFARRRPPSLGVADLRQVARRTATMFDNLARRSRVYVEFLDDSGPMTTILDEGQIQQAITNLIVNAIQAMPTGGRLRLRLGRETATPPEGHAGAPGEWLCLSVADEGLGIRDEDLPRVFEPFFTTKDVGVGTGLGLSVTHGIVSEHGGWIAVESAVGKGSRFTIYLPAAAGTAS